MAETITLLGDTTRFQPSLRTMIEYLKPFPCSAFVACCKNQGIKTVHPAIIKDHFVLVYAFQRRQHLFILKQVGCYSYYISTKIENM